MIKGLAIKKIVHQSCCDFVHNRNTNIQNNIKGLQESLTSETKSSAGDKHETGRAMIQLELEKLADQQKETRKLQEALSKIDIDKLSSAICLGSIVFTNQHNYFIGISAGEIIIDKLMFYAISPNTPIGKLLFGKVTGAIIDFRGQKITIIKVI